MHAELNYNGNKQLKNVPKCNQIDEESAYNFFMSVHNDLNLSIFSYLFYGILKSNTVCSFCNTTLYNFQYFQFLCFPAYKYHNKVFNIYKGFKDFIEEEIMSGDNQCYCQNCQNLRDAKVTTKIFYSPPYLVINFDYGKNKKYKPSKVEFGEVIDLTTFTDIKCSKKTYELVSVVSHIGESGNMGHYIAYCKDSHGLWHEFNDSVHSNCSFQNVNSNSPYLIIYKNID